MVDVVMDAELSAGEFARQESHFRDWVGPDPSNGQAGEYPPEAGRYHLYVSLACPWCHRTAILREVAGIQQPVGISYLAPFRDERGWAFTGERFEDGPGGVYTDDVNGWAFMSEAYTVSDPSFTAGSQCPCCGTRTAGGSSTTSPRTSSEADWRLFPTLVRFDEVYNVHFRCNYRRLVDYPNLWGYSRELYRVRAWPRPSPWIRSSVTTTRRTTS